MNNLQAFIIIFLILKGHFLEILDVMYGSSRNFVYMQILNMATRYLFFLLLISLNPLAEILLALCFAIISSTTLYLHQPHLTLVDQPLLTLCFRRVVVG